MKFELYEFYCIYNKLGLNAQVTYVYYASNIYLKFFLCATTLRKWHIYEIVTIINLLVCQCICYIYLDKFIFFNSLFIMLLPGTRSK